MVMQFTIIEVVSLITIFQSLLMSVFFFSLKKGNGQSNKILSTILFVFAVLILYTFITNHGASVNVYKVAVIGSQAALLIGPLIFLYLYSRLEPKFRFNKKHLIHFLPFILACAYFVIRFYILNLFIQWESPVRVVDNIIILIQNSVYIILVARLLRTYNIPVKSIILTSKNYRLSWLRLVLLGYIAIWSINFQFLVVFDVFGKYGLCPFMFSLYFLTLFLLLNTILFITLRRPTVVIKSKKYETSTLSIYDKERLKEVLEKYMLAEKPFLDPRCSLSSLSQELSISPNHLSQLINESYNQNFFDFINEYRIEESKRLLGENGFRKKTILEIAYEVGINSKTTFNKAFKKFTGVTPSEYRNLIYNSAESQTE